MAVKMCSDNTSDSEIRCNNTTGILQPEHMNTPIGYANQLDNEIEEHVAKLSEIRKTMHLDQIKMIELIDDINYKFCVLREHLITIDNTDENIWNSKIEKLETQRTDIKQSINLLYSSFKN